MIFITSEATLTLTLKLIPPNQHLGHIRPRPTAVSTATSPALQRSMETTVDEWTDPPPT